MSRQHIALEFHETEIPFESVEVFEKNIVDQVQEILTMRYEKFVENENLEPEKMPPLPFFVFILFDDLKAASTQFFPANENEKLYCLKGVKHTIQRFLKKGRKIIQVTTAVEAWVSQMSTDKDSIPFKNELTDEQLLRKMKHRVNQNPEMKETRIILDHQLPGEVNGQLTSVCKCTEIYKLFEHKILVEKQVLDSGSQNIYGDHFAMFKPLDPEEEKKMASKAPFDFNVATAIEYVKTALPYLQ
jgi:hypothetical protein